MTIGECYRRGAQGSNVWGRIDTWDQYPSGCYSSENVFYYNMHQTGQSGNGRDLWCSDYDLPQNFDDQVFPVKATSCPFTENFLSRKITENECKSWVSSMGGSKVYDRTDEWADYVPGCFNHGNTYHFNTHPTGNFLDYGDLWCTEAKHCPNKPSSGKGYGTECVRLAIEGTCTQNCTTGYTAAGSGAYNCASGTLGGGNLTCTALPCKNGPNSIVYPSGFDNTPPYNLPFASLLACSENSHVDLGTTGLNSEWFVAEENNNIHRCRVDCFKNSIDERSMFKKVNTVPNATLVSSAKKFATIDGSWSHDAEGIKFTSENEEFYFPSKCSQCNA